MSRTQSLVASIRDAFAGPAARTTIVLGLVAATYAVAAPMVSATEPPAGVQVSARR